MKKITLNYLVAGIVLLLMSATVSAQETKVSKKITIFDWLDQAVVDGNQVEGGLHVYADWAGVTAGLKEKQQKLGMLVTVVDVGDGTTGTFRLTQLGANREVQHFERVDALLVADIAARDALIDDVGVTDAGLAIGTIVGVTSDDSGEFAAFFYAGGTDWIALAGGSSYAAGGGFIAVGQQDAPGVSFTNGFDSDDSGASMNNTGVGAITTSDAAKKIDSFEEFEFTLTQNGEMPFIAYPKAWNKPNFFIKIGADPTEHTIMDCWTVTYAIQDGVEYQQWKSTVNFTTGASSDMTLIVR